MFRSAAGLSSRSTGSTSARTRLRAKSRLEVGLVVGERQACLGGEAARLGALELQQRPHDAAAAGRQAAERPRSRARRRGGRGPSRPGRFACGRSRSSRCRCARAAARRRRSAHPAPRPGGFPAQLPGSLDVQIDPQPRAEVAADALVAVGRVAKAVVDVQRVHARGPDRMGQAGGRAGGIGAAGDQDDPGGERGRRVRCDARPRPGRQAHRRCPRDPMAAILRPVPADLSSCPDLHS